MRIKLKFPWFTPGGKTATLLAAGEHEVPDEWRDKLPKHAKVLSAEPELEKSKVQPAEDFKTQLLREQAEGDFFAKALEVHSAAADKLKGGKRGK